MRSFPHGLGPTVTVQKTGRERREIERFGKYRPYTLQIRAGRDRSLAILKQRKREIESKKGER